MFDPKNVKINLTDLSMDEINVLLGSLGAQPFNQVSDLIFKVKNQAIGQIAAAEAAAREVAANIPPSGGETKQGTGADS